MQLPMGISFKVDRFNSHIVLTWALFVCLPVSHAEGTQASNTAPVAHNSGDFLCPTQPQYVHANGSTDIDLGTAASMDHKTVSLKVSTFISKDQDVGEIGFNGTAPGEPLQPELSSYQIAGPHLTPPLFANDLNPGTSYAGTLWITGGDHSVTACELELVMPKYPRGELRTDRASVSRAVMLRMWFGDPDDAHASFILYEKDRRRVDAVSAVFEGASTAPSGTFDPTQFLTFLVNGTPNPRFMGTFPSDPAPPDAAKTIDLQAAPIVIPRDRQLGIGMQFHSLSSGQYTFSLRLSAADAAVPGPKVDVSLTVRHHWIWAVLAVFLALAVSFVISKGIVNWRERIRIRTRIAQLEIERFDAHASLPSVVFLRAVLDQSTQLVEKERLLPPPPSVYDYLTRADRVVTIIRRYSLLKQDLDACPCLDSVKFHYNQAIADIMGRIGPQPLDQKTTDGIVEDLAAINSRLTDDPDAWYWTTLKTKATLLAKRAEEVRSEFGTQSIVDDWLGKLQNFPVTQDRSVDHAFWMMNLLYSRREFSDDVSSLIKRYTDSTSLTETLKLADDLAWTRLTQAAANKAVRILRLDDSDAQETLSPTKFLLHFDDPVIGESYLVTNILKYQWHFDLSQVHKPRGFRRKEPQTRHWTATTSGPRVTQYVPFAGQMKVSTTIRRITSSGVEQLELPPLSVPVIENTELSLVKALDGSELFLMGIIAAVALVTSIPALYLAKPTFGSFADYVAILAWAIGIDQGKNLVQLMKTFPADAPPDSK